jgi:hypothetical protein
MKEVLQDFEADFCMSCMQEGLKDGKPEGKQSGQTE